MHPFCTAASRPQDAQKWSQGVRSQKSFPRFTLIRVEPDEKPAAKAEEEPDEKPETQRQAAEPLKVELVGPTRDRSWWLTAFGPVIIAAAALGVALYSVVDQHDFAVSQQSSAARSLASMVSFSKDPAGQLQYDIDNYASAPITSVLLQSAPRRSLVPLSPIGGCKGVTVIVPSADEPVIYFRDANGDSWVEPANGVAEPAPDPSAILGFLPSSALSNRSLTEGQPQTLSC